VLSYNYYINQKVDAPETGKIFMTTILTTVLVNLVIWISILWVKSADVLKLLSKISITLVLLLVIMFIGFYVMTFKKTVDKY
jgi:TctA family transporter